MRLTFGKYKNYEVSEVPSDYLEWCVDTLESAKWRRICKEELARRESEEKELINRILTDSNSLEVRKILIDKFYKEYEKEVLNSNVPWEYSGYLPNFDKMISDYIWYVTQQDRLNKLNNEYNQTFGSNTIREKVLDYWMHDLLDESCFSSKENYQIAVQYCNLYSELATNRYCELSQVFDRY